MWQGRETWHLTLRQTKIQNYVLGGIIGGVIYNSSISIVQYAVYSDDVDDFGLDPQMAQ